MKYDSEETKENNFSVFLAPESIEWYKQDWSKICAGDQQKTDIKLINKGGREIWIRALFTVHYEEDKRKKITMLAYDISENKATEKEVEKCNVKLKTAKKESRYLEKEIKRYTDILETKKTKEKIFDAIIKQIKKHVAIKYENGKETVLTDTVIKEDKNILSKHELPANFYDKEQEQFLKAIEQNSVKEKTERIQINENTKWLRIKHIPFYSDKYDDEKKCISIIEDISKRKKTEVENEQQKEIIDIITEEYPVFKYKMSEDFELVELKGKGFEVFPELPSDLIGKDFRQTFKEFYRAFADLKEEQEYLYIVTKYSFVGEVYKFGHHIYRDTERWHQWNGIAVQIK